MEAGNNEVQIPGAVEIEMTILFTGVSFAFAAVVVRVFLEGFVRVGQCVLLFKPERTACEVILGSSQELCPT